MSARSIILNERVFSDSYLPPKLLYRDSELSKVREFTLGSLEEGKVPVTILYGPAGIGKTAMARTLTREFHKSGFLAFYANGASRSYNSEAKIIKEVLTTIWPSASLEGIGAIDVADLLLNALKTKKMRAVIAIDEATNVIYRKRGSEGLLELVSKGGGLVSLILCTLESDWIYTYIDFSKRGVVLTLKLEKFSKSQLKEIIRERAEKGLLAGSYDESLLDFVAELSSSEGTPRAAIKTLYYAAKIAEERGSSEISAEDVRKSFSMIPNSISLSKIYALDPLGKAILLAAYRAISKKPYTSLREIMEEYEGVREEFSDYLREIKGASKTLIRARLKTIVRMGLLRETRISREILFCADFPLEIMIEKLEEAILGEGEDLSLDR